MEQDSSINPYMVLYCGNNEDGQAGIAYPEPAVATFEVMRNERVMAAALTHEQTFLVLSSGAVVSSGANENGELGRKGKRSRLENCSALDWATITQASAGKGFMCFVDRNKGMLTWGTNSHGQLGASNRDFSSKPRLLTCKERILLCACGSAHSVVLGASRSVYTFGLNDQRSQCGTGNVGSVTTPYKVPELTNRPIVKVSCGEHSSFAVTSGGNLYAWGANNCGQLGFGDTTVRRRPELVRALRAAGVGDVQAGGSHTVVLSRNGLVFTTGSNSHGQLGISTEMRMQTTFTVVDFFRDLSVETFACGKAHTIVVTKRKQVYGLGCNAQGQLSRQPDSSRSVLPEEAQNLIASQEATGGSILRVFSGPLSSGTVLTIEPGDYSSSSNSSPDAQDDFKVLLRLCEAYIASPTNAALVRLRELIGTVFSSSAAINAAAAVPYSARKSSSTRGGVDFAKVHVVYERIVQTASEHVLSTLGRATLSLTEDLLRVPTDDVENISVFLVVMENPLLNAAVATEGNDRLPPSSFHIILQRLCTGILSLPKQHRVQLFSWLQLYESQHFVRVLKVFSGFLSFCLESTQTGLSPTPAVLVLDALNDTNAKSQRLPQHLMYCEAVTRRVDLQKAWQEWIASESDSTAGRVFNFFDYSFLLPLRVKAHFFSRVLRDRRTLTRRLISTNYIKRRPDERPPGLLFTVEGTPFDSVLERLSNSSGNAAADETAMETDSSTTPAAASTPSVEATRSIVEASAEAWFRVRIRRSCLLDDFLAQLERTLAADASVLGLPLNVVFEGEPGQDQGGVAKELIRLGIKAFIEATGVVRPTSSGSWLWFSPDLHKSVVSEQIGSSEKAAHLLGLMVGLAAMNEILVDLRIPPCIFKILAGQDLELADLFTVDSELAQGLATLLELDSGDVAALDMEFVASSQPLIPSRGGAHVEEELVRGGQDIQVTASNRHRFVNSFVEHALLRSVEPQVCAYLRGLTLFIGDKISSSSVSSASPNFKNRVLEITTVDELEKIINGEEEVGDLSALRLATSYSQGYTDESKEVNWFWNWVADLNTVHKRRFLSFTSGSDRIPVGGLGQLRLVLVRTEDPTKLPVARTCFMALELPAYPSESTMRTKLDYAMQHACEGFGLA